MNRTSLSYDEFLTLSFLASQHLSGSQLLFADLSRVLQVSEGVLHDRLSSFHARGLVEYDYSSQTVERILVAPAELGALLGGE